MRFLPKTHLTSLMTPVLVAPRGRREAPAKWVTNPRTPSQDLKRFSADPKRYNNVVSFFFCPIYWRRRKYFVLCYLEIYSTDPKFWWHTGETESGLRSAPCAKAYCSCSALWADSSWCKKTPSCYCCVMHTLSLLFKIRFCFGACSWSVLLMLFVYRFLICDTTLSIVSLYCGVALGSLSFWPFFLSCCSRSANPFLFF